jgi:hypothetical protein
MTLYIHNGTAWQTFSGTDRPYVNVSGVWQPVNYVYVHNGSGWQTAFQYNTGGPNVPTPTFTQSATSSSVSWTAITDDVGIASATLYQEYVGSSSGTVAGSTYTIPSGSYSGGSRTMSIPTSKRMQQSGGVNGESWRVRYWIVATDTDGYTTTGSKASLQYTKPYGTFVFAPTDADSWTGSAWGGLVSPSGEGTVRKSTTWASGAWFYGTTVSDSCLGWTPDTGSISVVRPTSTQTYQGNTGTFTLQYHNKTSASGTPTFAGTGATIYLSGYGSSGSVSFPSDWRTAFGNGTAKGVALTNHNNQPGYLQGMTNFSGWITLNFT